MNYARTKHQYRLSRSEKKIIFEFWLKLDSTNDEIVSNIFHCIEKRANRISTIYHYERVQYVQKKIILFFHVKNFVKITHVEMVNSAKLCKRCMSTPGLSSPPLPRLASLGLCLRHHRSECTQQEGVWKSSYFSSPWSLRKHINKTPHIQPTNFYSNDKVSQPIKTNYTQPNSCQFRLQLIGFTATRSLVNRSQTSIGQFN